MCTVLYIQLRLSADSVYTLSLFTAVCKCVQYDVCTVCNVYSVMYKCTICCVYSVLCVQRDVHVYNIVYV